MVLLYLPLLIATPQDTTQLEHWPDGTLRSEAEVRETGAGPERHGSFRSYHPDGSLRSEGRFSQGEEVGSWVFYHPNGEVAEKGSFVQGKRVKTWRTYDTEGRAVSKGKYDQGERSGPWTFWTPDGEVDPLHTGVYRADSHLSRVGTYYFHGERLDGERHGVWKGIWPTGEVMLEASFERGVREGAWIFRHTDGSVSSTLVSGLYTDGRWSGPLPDHEGEKVPTLERVLAPVYELALEKREASRGAIEHLLANEAASKSPPPVLEAESMKALPLAIELVLACDAETEAGRRRIEALDGRVLSRLLGGVRMPRAGDVLSDPSAARELARSWASLWALSEGDPWFWRFSMRFAEQKEGRSPLADPTLLVAPLPGAASYASRSDRGASASKARAQALQDALTWLALHQAPDGRFDADAFPATCPKEEDGPPACVGAGRGHDVGVTGLALLAFLGAGHTPRDGAFARTVDRGLQWLLSQVGKDGAVRTRSCPDVKTGKDYNCIFGRWHYEQALATAAICEAIAQVGETRPFPAVQRAVAMIQRGRNPYGAWKYENPPIGDNDTSVTSWMLFALHTARNAGYAVAPECFEGGLSWIDEVSDPATGRCGYDTFGSTSARSDVNVHYPREKGEAMTAAALWTRFLLGQDPESSDILTRHADLLRRVRPVWEPESFGCDMYYWYFGTLGMYQMGGSHWKAWEQALWPAIVDSQRTDGHARGSWDPVGPWGYVGGRIYSTAMMAMCLEVEGRYPRFTAR